MWKNIKGTCNRCGKEGLLFPSFGKWICVDCKNNRPKKFKGNSGLFQGEYEIVPKSDDLYLERVKKSNPLFGKLFFEHYPQSKGIPGRSFCYLIINHGRCVGIIGFNSPPQNYKKFKEFFNTDDSTLYLNNNVFRLIEHEQNLGTRVLKLARRQVQQDYIEKWGYPLLGLVTFVEPPRTGAVYKADNWIFLGETKGLRLRRDKETWDRIYTEGTKKLIFAYKYSKN